MIGKMEIIGEWAADGSLEETDEHRIINMSQLNEAIKQKVYELDLQLLLAGLLTILGIHQDAGEKRYTLEVHVPLFIEDDEEYDVSKSVTCCEPVSRSFSPQPKTSVARAAVCATRSA